ncbi:hypothetical protein SAMN04489834_1407 [Microterricola viridarii]|uniref:Bacteriocin biosynthesis cyclodehydratase domain-containing protein n=1 Tax=Microterricola viridarii TaxID=412690 RepID=A0A1H1RVQ3_9MICO|nr:hypothetical protein SAMN04489834_1407 [Microterricola viridarii]
MILRLDPAAPVVWRSPSSLQFGVDSPRLVLDVVDALDEALVAALRAGAQREDLLAVAKRSGADAAELEARLDRLEPVLQHGLGRPQPSVPRVLIDGEGRCAELLLDALLDAGVTASVSDPLAGSAPRGGEPELVVLIARYAVPPARYGHWLRADVAHLPIVFGDSGVRVGPLVQPGAGPCLFCLDLERTDRDAAWPALASQLVHRRAPGATEQTSRLAATTACGLILACSGAPAALIVPEPWSAASVHIGLDGWISSALHSPHPECGCRGLPGAPSRRGSGNAPAGHAPRLPSPPS